MKVIDNGRKIKVTKVFLSIMKEKIWLEEMAKKGYRLCNMTMGMYFTFEKIEPTHLIYEIDRFDLPDSPTLEDIHKKEEFLEFASDMGWTPILHDEAMNYYFCKEVTEENSSEELYNDAESRRYHAEKCTRIFQKQKKQFIHLSLFGIAMFLIVAVISLISNGTLNTGYSLFTVIYTAFCIGSYLFTDYFDRLFYQDLMTTKEEWLRLNGKSSNSKRVTKLFFRTKSLQRYLTKQSEQGWQIIKIQALHYSFIYDNKVHNQYLFDSKYYTNRRLHKKGHTKLSDGKDIGNMNYDWIAQSVNDAAALSWDYVCSHKNALTLYSKPADQPYQSLNDSHALPRAGVFCNKYGVYLTSCVLIGAIAGFLAGLFLF